MVSSDKAQSVAKEPAWISLSKHCSGLSTCLFTQLYCSQQPKANVSVASNTNSHSYVFHTILMKPVLIIEFRIITVLQNTYIHSGIRTLFHIHYYCLGTNCLVRITSGSRFSNSIRSNKCSMRQRLFDLPPEGGLFEQL